jgi:type I restriction-modification system DNA methylase subunit
LEYFIDRNKGYQDLYQIGLINDLRNKIGKMIYVIPSNFIFGNSVSNKIRDDLFREYTINNAFVFEQEIFEFTGTNVIICFFEKKTKKAAESFSFSATKINGKKIIKEYFLNPINHYRAGGGFNDFINNSKANNPLKFKYYFTIDDKNELCKELKVIDVNKCSD